MIGPVEKGMQAAKLQTPPQGVWEGVDLRVMPKYICFKAALLHNRLTQQYVILILSLVLLLHYGITRFEIHSLYGKLREKEFILAPGVQDFTPASPQTVSDSYVSSAVSDFLNQLGNVTAENIDEQYKNLSEAMSPQFRIRFINEAEEWKSKVKTEKISEILSVTEKEIRQNSKNLFDVTALTRRNTYIGQQYIGQAEEVIEMTLELIPPKSDRRWFIQIDNLTRQSPEIYKAKRKL